MFFNYEVTCDDNADWDDNNGYIPKRDCGYFARYNCENGRARPGKADKLGAVYNYPEQNCCACGKANYEIKKGKSNVTVIPAIITTNNMLSFQLLQ